MKKLLILLLALIVSVTMLQAKRTKIKYTDYTVQGGDTLFLIAKKHHTTTEEVRNSNDLEKGQLIKVGQTLKVPVNTYFPKSKTASKKNAKKGMVEYVVSAGDTLFVIAKKHHTTTQEVRDTNEMERGALIRVGQKLKVPTNTYFPNENKTVAIAKKIPKRKAHKKGISDYSIEKGDTLFIIARKHHTTTQEIRDVNGMERGTLIKVGQNIKVPTNTYFPDGQKEEVKVAEKEQTKGIYEIQSGDTLFSIARKHHVTLKALMVLNSIEAGGIIKVGQKLKVSKKASFIAKKQKPKSKKVKLVVKKYKVKRGDTLSRIAKRNKTSIQKLRSLNKLSRRSILRPGMILAVGSTKVEIKAKSRTYRVRKGDTLWLIANKHKTTVRKLRALNKLSRRAKLYKGMVLAIDGKLKKSKSKIKNNKQYIAKKKSNKNTKKIASRKRKSGSKRLTSAMAMLGGKSSGSRGSRSGAKVIRTAKRYLGTRYVWGAEGPNRFDCSGFTQYVIRKSKGVRLPRVSRKQAYYGKYVSRGNLRAGDLIFFDTSHRRRGYVNHVGIYIGSNKFIHASSARHRVVITSLNRPFYKARFKWGRRVN